MEIQNKSYQTAIVGGGPVGLFLGCCLQQAGVSCIILEQRAGPVTHSRSIGIHPISLELFDEIDLAEKFIKNGIKVRAGQAFWESENIGTLSFASCPHPYRFILTLPQSKTEQLLASHLVNLNPIILQRNTKVIGIEESADSVQLKIIQNGKGKDISAKYVIGCDGMNSFVRKSAGIAFNGKTYDDSYIMGDFSDNTDFGPDAAIFLGREGLIESFPLADNKRRWVVKTDLYYSKVQRMNIDQRVKRRTGFQLRETENYMLSSFRVFRKQSEAMAKGRTILAGDSAHIVSPIGGQGMNLGWLDAADLSKCFQQIFSSGDDPSELLQAYSDRRLNIAKKAARRATFNMVLGRKTKAPFFKKMILRMILKKPFSKLMANLFTMRGLQKWVI